MPSYRKEFKEEAVMDTTMHLASGVFKDTGVRQMFERLTNLWVNEVLIV